MNKTAIVYSHEEALAMKPENRPMCYRVPGSIYTACFEAVGAGSMCWHPRPSAQTFDASTAETHTLTLLFTIAKELEKAGMIYENWPESWKGGDAECSQTRSEVKE